MTNYRHPDEDEQHYMDFFEDRDLALEIAKFYRDHPADVPEYLLLQWLEDTTIQKLANFLLMSEYTDEEMWDWSTDGGVRNDKFWAFYNFVLTHNPELDELLKSRQIIINNCRKN